MGFFEPCSFQKKKKRHLSDWMICFSKVKQKKIVFTPENERRKLQDPPICTPENHLKHHEASTSMSLCSFAVHFPWPTWDDSETSKLLASFSITFNRCFKDFGARKNTTLPETNGWPQKINGWKMILSFWGPAHLQVRLLLVSGSVTLTASWDFESY